MPPKDRMIRLDEMLENFNADYLLDQVVQAMNNSDANEIFDFIEDMHRGE